MIEKLVETLLDVAKGLFKARQGFQQSAYDRFVKPTDAAFQALHGTYLKSFEGYRDWIRANPDKLAHGCELFDRIASENRFNDHLRTQVIGLMEMTDQVQLEMSTELQSFGEDSEAIIVEYVGALGQYLMRSRAADADTVAEAQDRLGLFTQRFRNSLIEDLRAVVDENWLFCLDPSASMPPGSASEIAAEISRIAADADIAPDDPQRVMKIRQKMALLALDRIVEEMQEAYAAVMSRHHALVGSMRIKH